MATYSNTAFQFFSITTAYFITFMAKNCLIHLFIYLLVHITPINFTIPRKEASLYPLSQPPGSSCCSGSGEGGRPLFTPWTVPGDCYLYQPCSQRTALPFLVKALQEISQFTAVFPSWGNMQKKHLPFSCLSLFTRSNARHLQQTYSIHDKHCRGSRKAGPELPCSWTTPSTLQDTWITTSDAVG